MKKNRGTLIWSIIAVVVALAGVSGCVEKPVDELPLDEPVAIEETIEIEEAPIVEVEEAGEVEESTVEIVTAEDAAGASSETAPPITVEEDGTITVSETHAPESVVGSFDLSTVASFSDQPYVTVNGNVPYFEEEDFTSDGYEYYGPLDSLGRCSYAVANVCKELMPTEERGSIGQVKPSGWHTVRYDDLVDGKYLYNRCHLIGYQLSAENANVQNLITGTRYMNTVGMLPFENEVASYVNSTDNHVLYRVTPIFDGDNLLASGVLMEARSYEDSGTGVQFCVFVYNAQPGITIDYATGDSAVSEQPVIVEQPETDLTGYSYILNTNSMVIHLPSCSSVKNMSESNKQGSNASCDDLMAQGYRPCERCSPCALPVEEPPAEPEPEPVQSYETYVLNTNTNVFHKPNCGSVKQMNPSNRLDVNESRDTIIASGYRPCKKCRP